MANDLRTTVYIFPEIYHSLYILFESVHVSTHNILLHIRNIFLTKLIKFLSFTIWKFLNQAFPS